MKKNLTQIPAKDGFSLVEVMVVMALFVMGVLAVGEIQTRSVITNTVTRKNTHASALAADRIENLIGLSYDHPTVADRSGDGVAGLDNISEQTADGFDAGHPPYMVYWNTARIPAAFNPEEINYKRVRVLVTWRDRGATRRYPLDTIKTEN